MDRQVLSDASPLIGLALVDGLTWLNGLFGNVLVPQEVLAEVLGRGFVGEAVIRQAMDAHWLQVAGNAPVEPALPDLDEGEAACIRLALAAKVPALLLMDERAGRAVALEQGLQVAGTAAVIGMAKIQGLIPAAKPVLDTLHRSDFRISAEVIRTVLRRVGE
jgi:predicted nucleic acid-binding protein